MMVGAILLAALVDFVDPFIGTGGTGHCTPAATRPFGMVQAGPDTGNCNWNYCSGYQYADREITGFTQTHLNGTGSSDLGDVRIFPLAKPKATKSDERAAPGYYAVTLDGDVRVEITATKRVAFYRFTYPEGRKPCLDVNFKTVMCGDYENPDTAVLEVRTNAVSATKVSASVHTKVWAERWCHSVVEHREEGRMLLAKVALSATSAAGAERNLSVELPHWDFDRVRAEATAEWEKYLGRLAYPEGNPDADRKMFHTSIYRLCVQPNVLSDVGERPFYTTFSLWDTFRAAHPLYYRVCPELVPDFVNSLLEQGRRTGYLPIWPLWGRETQAMIGTHGVPVIVDAYLRGVKGLEDAESAYAQVKDTLTKAHAERTKERWDLLDKYGYYPCDVIKGESVSRLLECSFDDWCAAEFAEKLGKRDDAAFFRTRSACWTNVYDKTIGFMRGRTTTGAWRTPYDPKDVGHNVDTDNDFTEGNAYQWSWHVLHDPTGLIAALGGAEATVKRLDALFTADSTVKGSATTVDVTGLIGQYAHGNEPSHHIPFLYTLCGRPDKTRALVKRIMRDFYIPKPDGLSGNDDCGQMSAWYVWAAIGEYPVTPCGGKTVRFTEP